MLEVCLIVRSLIRHWCWLLRLYEDWFVFSCPQSLQTITVLRRLLRLKGSRDNNLSIIKIFIDTQFDHNTFPSVLPIGYVNFLSKFWQNLYLWVLFISSSFSIFVRIRALQLSIGSLLQSSELTLLKNGHLISSYLMPKNSGENLKLLAK